MHDLAVAREIYRQWRKKWAVQKGEAAVKPFDNVIEHCISNTWPRTIVPNNPASPVTAILVEDGLSLSHIPPVGNQKKMLILYDNGRNVENFAIAPKDGIPITDDLLLAYAEKRLAGQIPAGAEEYGDLLIRDKHTPSRDTLGHFSLFDIKQDPRQSFSSRLNWENDHWFSQEEGKYIKPPPLYVRKEEKRKFPERIPEEAVDELSNSLYPIQIQVAKEAWTKFRKHLNPQAMELLEKHRTAKVSIHGPMSFEYRYLAIDGPEGERRREGLREFPFLIDSIYGEGQPVSVQVLSPLSPDKGDRISLDEAIKAGRNMQEILAEAAEASPAVIRRIMGMPSLDWANPNRYLSATYDKHNARFFDYSHLIYLLGQIPDINTIPFYRKEPEKFQALLSVMKGCCFAAADILLGQVTQLPSLKELVHNIKGDMRPLISKHGGEEQFFNDVGNISDYIEEVMDVIVLPELMRRLESRRPAKTQKIDYDGIIRDLKEPLRLALFKGRDLGQVLNLSEIWHRNVGALENEIRIVPRKGKWGRLIPDTEVPLEVCPSGLTITALPNAKMLYEEGERMGHCVGGYTDRCIKENFHILSIRDREGKSISTLELKEVENKRNEIVAIEQHQGPENDLPSAEARKAADWLVSQINTRHIEVDLEKMQNARERAQELQKTAQDIIGFNPLDETRVELAFKRYHALQLLAKNITSRKDFFEKTGLQEAIDKILSALDQGKYSIKEQDIARRA